jgi:hypothetical protein
MTPPRRDDGYLRATRVYRWLVRLYPAAYRRLFGEQMLQTFQDHYRDAVATGEESETGFWLGVFADEARAIPRAQFAAAQETWRRWSASTSASQGSEEPITMTVPRPQLRRYWLPYLLLLLLVPVAAALHGLRIATDYETSANIFVATNTFLTDFQSQEYNSFATKAQNVADQLSQLLQSASFLVSVANDTSLANMYDLHSSAGQDAVVTRIGVDIAVSANPTRNIVTITVADQYSPQVAQELTAGVIREFVAFYASNELYILKVAQDFYDKQLADVNAKVADDAKKVSDYQRQHPEALTPAGGNDPTWVALKQQLAADQAIQLSTQTNVQAVAQAMHGANGGTSYEIKPLDPAPTPHSATVQIRRLLVYPIAALSLVLILFALTGISYRARVALD